jgi:hypothetical protein
VTPPNLTLTAQPLRRTQVDSTDVVAGPMGNDEWMALQAAGGWKSDPTCERKNSGPSERVNWHQLLEDGAPEPSWLVEPILPAGRMTAIVASAKTGKSLLTLDLALALATGRQFLGKPAGNPVKVMLLDFEMTDGDLVERVEDMGFGISDADLLAKHFAYYLGPDLQPFNTARGASQILELVDLESPELLIVDTLSRAVAGDENSSEPYLEAYRLVWSQLKRRNVAVLRNDHTGHESKTRGRGSSAKRDDVDLSWVMKVTPRGVQLAHHGTSRMGWVPETVDLLRSEGAVPMHQLAPARELPEGTEEWVAVLDELGADRELGERTLRAWLKEGDRLAAVAKAAPPRSVVLRAAIKLRSLD